MKYLPFLLAGLLIAGAAHAAHQAETVHAHDAWIRVLPGDLPAGGYVTLENSGDTPAVLVGARSRAYGRVMLHKSTETAGMSHMKAVDTLTVPAHGTLRLAPGGYHLMMMDPAKTVHAGHAVRVTIAFADGSAMDVLFKARPANATGS